MQNNTRHSYKETKLLIAKKKLLKVIFIKLPVVGYDKTDSGIEFHSIGAVTKNECLNASIVELT